MKRFILFVLGVLLLCACQPTPSTETVVNKGDNRLETAVKESAVSPYTYEAPAHWTETISMKTISIEIDADVLIPDTDLHPIQTIQNRDFTAEDILHVLSACAGQALELRENRISIDEITEEIRFVMRGDYAGEDDETGKVLWRQSEDAEERLAELRDQLAACPAEDSFVPLTAKDLTLDGMPNVIRGNDGRLWYATCTGQALNITVTRNPYLQDESVVLHGGFAGEPIGQELNAIKISEEDAKKAGMAFLEQLGLSDSFGIGEVKKARLAHPVPTETGFEVLSEGYTVRFAPTCSVYLPFPSMFYSENMFFKHEDEYAYVQRLKTDEFEVYLSENGIEAISSYNPTETVLIANENVSLLSFDKVQERIRNQLHYGYAWTDENSNGLTTLHVNKLILSCTVTRMEGITNEMLLVPTWIVLYNDNRSENALFKDSILLINAIDGSIQ